MGISTTKAAIPGSKQVQVHLFQQLLVAREGAGHEDV
jgi:hypothetical protein